MILGGQRIRIAHGEIGAVADEGWYEIVGVISDVFASFQVLLLSASGIHALMSFIVASRTRCEPKRKK
jgi:hypothetical protein